HHVGGRDTGERDADGVLAGGDRRDTCGPEHRSPIDSEPETRVVRERGDGPYADADALALHSGVAGRDAVHTDLPAKSLDGDAVGRGSEDPFAAAVCGLVVTVDAAVEGAVRLALDAVAAVRGPDHALATGQSLAEAGSP